MHTYIDTYIHYITLHYVTLRCVALRYITLHYIHTYQWDDHLFMSDCCNWAKYEPTEPPAPASASNFNAFTSILPGTLHRGFS